VELTLGSGGMIVNGTITNAPHVRFGSAGPPKGRVRRGDALAVFAGQIVTSGGLTKFGDGALALMTATPLTRATRTSRAEES